MSVDIRLPNINAPTGEGQLAQIKSYLYQFVEQLNWALNNLDTGTDTANGNTVIASQSASRVGEADAQATFNGIKALIIKSADIVNAYYESMKTRFSGDYVAQSDYGIYTQQTNAQLDANSQSISALFTNTQEITDATELLRNQIIDVTANIRTGELYTDASGTPVYGVEVGQRTSVDGTEVFNKFARFTANRLSFYDNNDNEVAYVSDYKLYITNAQILGNLNLGSYVLDTSDGVAFRWG